MARRKINIIDHDELYRIACEDNAIYAMLKRYQDARLCTERFRADRENRRSEYERALYYQTAVMNCIEDCVRSMGYTPYMFSGVCSAVAYHLADDRTQQT